MIAKTKHISGYQFAAFRIALDVKVAAEFLKDKVLAEVEAALRECFGFEARAFAQPVALSEVIATVHTVAGVVAVDVDRLYRTTPPSTAPIAHGRLLATMPELGVGGRVSGAELLLLHTGPLDRLGAMS